jgi:hypothetical protein
VPCSIPLTNESNDGEARTEGTGPSPSPSPARLVSQFGEFFQDSRFKGLSELGGLPPYTRITGLGLLANPNTSQGGQTTDGQEIPVLPPGPPGLTLPPRTNSNTPRLAFFSSTRGLGVLAKASQRVRLRGLRASTCIATVRLRGNFVRLRDLSQGAFCTHHDH